MELPVCTLLVAFPHFPLTLPLPWHLWGWSAVTAWGQESSGVIRSGERAQLVHKMLSEGRLGVCLRGRVHRVTSLLPGSLRTCPEVCDLGDCGSWAWAAHLSAHKLGWRTVQVLPGPGLQLWNLRVTWRSWPPGPPWFWPYLALFYVANAQFGPSAPCCHRFSKPKPVSGNCHFCES